MRDAFMRDAFMEDNIFKNKNGDTFLEKLIFLEKIFFASSQGRPTYPPTRRGVGWGGCRGRAG